MSNPTPTGKFEVRILDMGQGDCNLIRCPSGEIVMIDCGTTRKGGDGIGVEGFKVRKFLGKRGVVDFLILTHADSDHYSRVRAALKGRRIEQVLHSDAIRSYSRARTSEWLFNEDISCERVLVNRREPGSREVTSGTFADGVAWSVDILASDKFDEEEIKPKVGAKPTQQPTIATKDRNACSIVTLLSIEGGDSVLFCGDATAETERFLRGESKRIGGLHTLLAPHHGSDSSSSKDFVKVTAPKRLIVSAGRTNSYCLPRLSVIKRYTTLNQVAPHVVLGYVPRDKQGVSKKARAQFEFADNFVSDRDIRMTAVDGDISFEIGPPA
ncbi:MAG TPA: MBL fold metallo-hydrolase [Acidimicrobiales bacterium]|nr:MBL fold metallo-hydrolase [Acidimicrobiales bacterium]